MFKKTSTALLGLAISATFLQAHAAESKKVDVLLIGGGIMSSTLGVWLNELEPSWSMKWSSASTPWPKKAPTSVTTQAPVTPVSPS
jgi:hypothetical protein